MDDSEFFLQATKEVESSKQVKSMWAKAMALADGDSEKAKYRYVRMRVGQLTNERSEAPLSENKIDPGRPSLSEGPHDKQKSELKQSPVHQWHSTDLSENAVQDGQERGSMEGQGSLDEGLEKTRKCVLLDADGPVDGSGRQLSLEADQRKKEFYEQRAEKKKKQKRIGRTRLVITCFIAGFGLAFFVEQRSLNAAGIGSALGASAGLAIIPLIFSLISIRTAWIAFGFVLLSALYVSWLEERDSAEQTIKILQNRVNGINASLPIMLNDHLKLVGMKLEELEDKHWMEIRTEIITYEKRDLNIDEIKGPISRAYERFLCAADWVRSAGVVNVKHRYYDKYERFIGAHPARIVACRNP